MASADKISLRPATADDLPSINAVIESAVLNWELPERVKRLALPSYQYTPDDMAHLQFWVAEAPDGITGLAALEPAEMQELPDHKQGLLLHGLFVHPDYQHRGIGTKLLVLAEQQVIKQGLDGLLVRAQSGAGSFFAANGMELLVDQERRNYQHRYWKQLA